MVTWQMAAERIPVVVLAFLLLQEECEADMGGTRNTAEMLVCT